MLLSVSPCLHWTRTSGDLVSQWKPSSGSTIRAFSQYFSMVLRYGVFYPSEEDRCTGLLVSQTHPPYPLDGFFFSNDVIRSRTGQPLLSDTICQRRLSFFGHLCRADIGQDHSIPSSPRLHSGSSQNGDEKLEDRDKRGSG